MGSCTLDNVKRKTTNPSTMAPIINDNKEGLTISQLIPEHETYLV